MSTLSTIFSYLLLSPESWNLKRRSRLALPPQLMLVVQLVLAVAPGWMTTLAKPILLQVPKLTRDWLSLPSMVTSCESLLLNLRVTVHFALALGADTKIAPESRHIGSQVFAKDIFRISSLNWAGGAGACRPTLHRQNGGKAAHQGANQNTSRFFLAGNR